MMWQVRTMPSQSFKRKSSFLRHNQEGTGHQGHEFPEVCSWSGAPGTGKTLMARAVAGEAGVPFFSLNAIRVRRDVRRRRSKPGSETCSGKPRRRRRRSRSSTSWMRSDGDAAPALAPLTTSEPEQTLNQLLGELDGFDERSRGHHSRGDQSTRPVLDQGARRVRDVSNRQVVIRSLPDKVGREGILRIHTAKLLTLRRCGICPTLARSTIGMSGAELGEPLQRGCAYRGEA